MWRIMGKSVLAHKGRLLRTAVAVMLGVSFVAGTYVLTDTLTHLFDNVMTQATAGVDVYVRAHNAFASTMSYGRDREPVPEALLAKVEAVPGVQVARGAVGGPAQLIGLDGKAIAHSGAPTFGMSWSDPPLTQIELRVGRKPVNSAEVAIDIATARRHGFKVGDSIGILLDGPIQRFTLVGLVGFGEADNLAGATMAVFDPETAQNVLGKAGVYDSIEVAAKPGVAAQELRSRIAKILPTGLEAVTGTVVTNESINAIKFFLNFFKTALLVFALIALFVGAFTIYNTFSIIVAQRTREFALLRSLGASPRQVLGSVAGEAIVVGLVASGVGIGLGVALAVGLKLLLKGVGMELPSSGMVLQTRTFVVSMALGLGMTLISALAPARKAARVPPLAAVRDVTAGSGGSIRNRVVGGGMVTAAGVGFLLEGLFGHAWNPLALVGLGALTIFLGIGALSPVIARPVATLIGAPLPRLTGISGQLARENSRRNVKRTATTAAALMVGIALITFVAVFIASIKASANRGLADSLKANFVVTNAQAGPPTPFSHDIAVRLNRLDQVGTVSAIRNGEWRYKGSTKMLTAIDPSTLPQLVDLGMKSGSVAGVAKAGVLISDNAARTMGVHVGQSIPMEFAKTGVNWFHVVGIFDNASAVGNEFLISLPDFEANFAETQDTRVFVRGNPGIPLASLRRTLETVTGRFPNVTLMDEAELNQSQQKQIDQLLALVNALLGLAIVIALVGIANTLGLSIMERTRELGLLRAVGMSRHQTRSMVRWEAVIITLLGATLGLVIGLFFGWAVVRALHDQGIKVLALPGIQLLVYLIGAGVAGVIAAMLPARRAARMEILGAIASE